MLVHAILMTSSPFFFFFFKVLAAFKQAGPSVLKFATSDFRLNDEFMLPLVMANPDALEHAMTRRTHGLAPYPSRKLALAAIHKDGTTLKFAKNFSNNKEIVLAAVMQNGSALQYADYSMRNDLEVCLAAVKQDASVSVFGIYGRTLSLLHSVGKFYFRTVLVTQLVFFFFVFFFFFFTVCNRHSSMSGHDCSAMTKYSV